MPAVSSVGAPYAPSERDLPTRIGPYRILRHAATGTTSDILVAREDGPLGFQRVVALKVLLPRDREDEVAALRLANEAIAYARLSHPAIVRLHDFVRQDGEVALVLEYIEGVTLSRLRGDLFRRGERLKDDACLFLACRLFGALSAAHSARAPLSGELAPVIHGDLNPSNLVVPWDGYAKVVDFGSARVTGIVRDVPTDLAGRTYLAPEQARGEAATPRADVYSACLVLWELLSGRRAVARGRRSMRELLEAQSRPELPSLAALRPDLPRALVETLARGLEPDPDRRDATPDELFSILRSFADLTRARDGLADALRTVRLAGLHEDFVETTPNLPEPEVGPHVEPSPPAPYVVPGSLRPVILPPPFAVPAKRRFPSALPASLALAGVCALIVAFLARPPAPTSTIEAAAQRKMAPRSDVPLPSDTRNPYASVPARGAIAAESQRASPAEARPAATPASPLAAAERQSAAPAPAEAPPPSPASQRGAIAVPLSRGGHRVWIDGRLAGASPGTFPVTCGGHIVRVGSQGAVQRVEVACGAELTVQ
jgi:serine/threonine protein kinase